MGITALTARMWSWPGRAARLSAGAGTPRTPRGGRGAGITQYVILGAGLDSFAYRSALSGRVRVFEVDRSATQDFKRGQLSAARIPVPDNVDFVSVDFEDGSLAGRSCGAGSIWPGPPSSAGSA